MPDQPQDPRFTFPPFNRGTPNYDTPNVPNAPDQSGDILLVERIEIEQGSYNPQPNDGSVVYENQDKNKWPAPLYLCKTVPAPDGKTALRYWSNARTTASQDAWNYDLNYAGEAISYPIIIRRYKILRSDYDEDDWIRLTPDPVVPTALLTKADVAELPDDHPQRSLFVIITAIYETLKGPIFQGSEVDTQFGLVTDYTRQEVQAGTVESGQVAGGIVRLYLLGGGTGYPASGNLTFTGGGGTGAAGTFTAVSGVITNAILTANGTGYTSDPTVSAPTGTGATFLAVSGATLIVGTQPLSTVKDLVKTTAVDLASLSTSLFYRFPSYINVPLPDVLDSLSGFFNANFNQGQSNHPATQQVAFVTGAGSVQVNPRGRAQSEASIMPELQWQITSPWGRVLADNWIFLLESPATIAQVLAWLTTAINLNPTTVTISHASPGVVAWTAQPFKNGQTVLFTTTGTLPAPLAANTIYYVVNESTNSFNVALTPNGSAINTTSGNTGTITGIQGVNPFPTFQPSSQAIYGQGGQSGVSVDAESNAYYGRNSDGSSVSGGYDWGNGFSYSAGVTNRTWHLPQTIHGALAITGSPLSRNISISADADASTLSILDGGSIVVAAISNTISESTSVNGSFQVAGGGTTLSATRPASIPSAGIYLCEITSTIHNTEVLMFHAAVVDFSVFASL